MEVAVFCPKCSERLRVCPYADYVGEFGGPGTLKSEGVSVWCERCDYEARVDREVGVAR